ncbi:MAG: hypothetical protein QNJ32_16910 [Xenococcaceae cyanobacterium MO_167.B27]|nr:hypothetical protein [Xenococcaceae cyanobacterium MO_167.B27]
MTLSTIISIAISLTFIYLASSVVISEIQETIAYFFKLRAKNLKESLYGLLGEDPAIGTPITEKFYEKYLKLPFNPVLASSLIQERKKVDQPKAANLEKTKLHELGAETPKGKQIKKLTREPEKITAQQFVTDLIELVRDELNYENGNFLHEKELEEIIKNLNSDECFLPQKMKLELTAIARKVINRFEKKQDQLKALDREIQSWFNTSMEYASEIYRRNQVVYSRVLALIVVLMFNIDTVNIIDNLSKAEVLSSTLSNTVMEVMTSNSGMTSCSQVNDQSQFQNCMSNIQTELATALDGIDTLPIGWNLYDRQEEQFTFFKASNTTPLNPPNIVKAVIGWTISAIAISMGAPFWYSILNNLINIKSNKSAKN